MAKEFSQQAYGAHFAEVAVSYGVSGVTGAVGVIAARKLVLTARNRLLAAVEHA